MPTRYVCERQALLSRKFHPRAQGFFLLSDAASVVLVTGKNCQALTLYPHFYGVIILRTFYVSRHVRQSVLIARLLCYPRVQVLQRFLLRRVVDVAPRAMSIFRKPFKPAIVEGATHTYCKHRNAVSQHFLNGVGVRVGVVILASVDPIADDKYDFPTVSRAAFQKLCGRKHGIIEGLRRLPKNLSRGTGNPGRSVRSVAIDARPIERPTGRHHCSLTVQFGPPEFNEQLVLIAGESFARMKKLVEFANKCFIQITHASNYGVEAILHFLGVAFFQIVIDQNYHRKRESLRSKDIDSLFDIVIKNAKFVLAEIEHQPPRVVFHGHW